MRNPFADKIKQVYLNLNKINKNVAIQGCVASKTSFLVAKETATFPQFWQKKVKNYSGKKAKKITLNDVIKKQCFYAAL